MFNSWAHLQFISSQLQDTKISVIVQPKDQDFGNGLHAKYILFVYSKCED